MDEADKYKQRLEAIAEKRRLQEEQDRARREMEDERLRLQQLKRKSLRDQWLMEGPPLSPTSPDTQSPRSPLWGSQAQEIEKRIDKLQSQSQRLAEEEEKLKEQMEGGQAEAVKAGGAREDAVHDAVVQNGENSATGLETTDDEVKTNQRPLVDGTAAVLSNGGAGVEAEPSADASELSNQSTTNGPVVASEDVTTMNLGPGSSLGVSEAEPCQLPNVDMNEEEEGTLVMRAECVIITDEGDDVPEDLTPQEDQRESMQAEETPLPNPEASQERGEAVEEVVKTGAAPETFTQPEKSEATEPDAEAQPAAADGEMQGDVNTDENEDGGTKAERQEKQSEEPTSMQVQSPSDPLEGTTVASVPVYSQSILNPKLEAEGAAASSSQAEDAATLPGQFQEVPLADPQEKQRTEAGPAEQEPLLSQARDLNTPTEPAAANSPASTETRSPTRPGQGEETTVVQHKMCLCCSVM